MKKSLVFVFCFVLVLSLTFVSAGFFGDIFKKVTGKVSESSDSYDELFSGDKEKEVPFVKDEKIIGEEFNEEEINKDKEREYVQEEIILTSNDSENIKNFSKYSEKEVFLISDKNWEDVLGLVPVAVWSSVFSISELNQTGQFLTGDSIEKTIQFNFSKYKIYKHPLLIYHEEDEKTNILFSEEDFEFEFFPNSNFSIKIFLSTNNLNLEEELILTASIQNIENYSNYLDALGLQNYFPLLDLISDPWYNIEDNFYPGEIREYQFNFTFFGTESGFDADSIIYFMQQYDAEKVTIVGESPLELDNLLIVQPELGVGLNSDQIKRIEVNDYLSYWENYSDVVYVKNNYELSLMASTYASLINAPLIIQGTELDQEINFENKNVICVWHDISTTSINNSLPISAEVISGQINTFPDNCDEGYNLDGLQKKYVNETNTDKIILVNPNDLNIKVTEEFQSDKSGNPIYEIYSKTSLASPILASAKHEVIFSTTVTDYGAVDEEFKLFMNENYLYFLENTNFSGKTPKISRPYLYNLSTNTIKKIFPDFTDKNFMSVHDLNKDLVLTYGLSSCHFTDPICKYHHSFYLYGIENETFEELELGKTPTIWKSRLYENEIIYLENIFDVSWEIKLKSYNLDTHEIVEYWNSSILSTQDNFFLKENYVIFDFVNELNNKQIGIYNLQTNSFTSFEKSFFSIIAFSGEWILFAGEDYKTHAFNIFTNEDLIIVEEWINSPNMNEDILTYARNNKVFFYNLSSKEIEKEIFLGDFYNFYSDLEIILYQDNESFTHLYNLSNNYDEIILGPGYITSSIDQEISFFLSHKSREFPINNYLTVMASPDAIPLKIFDGWAFGQENYRPAETSEYSDFFGDGLPNMFTGRMVGFTISDVSGYIARDLFHNEMYPVHKNITFIASSPGVTNLGAVLEASLILNDLGYNSLAQINETAGTFNSSCWEQNNLIAYFDHGSSSWAGILSSQIPNLVNSIILNDACSTCSNVGEFGESFCVQAIRKGALAHVGALNIAGASFTYEEMLNNFYYENLNLGQAYSLAYNPNAGSYINLLGDPTFNFIKPYILNESINWEEL